MSDSLPCTRKVSYLLTYFECKDIGNNWNFQELPIIFVYN